MITFYITSEQRRRAQDRAAALDIGRSDPPGRYPFVWDNRQNSVIRWYAYASPQDKRGSIYFQPLLTAEGESLGLVECTTEIITHHFLPLGRDLRQVPIMTPTEHDRLVEFFFEELLTDKQHPTHTR